MHTIKMKTMWFVYFLLITGVAARHHLHVSSRAWKAVVKASASHAVNDGWWQPPLGEQELRTVFDDVWHGLRSVCSAIPETHDVDVGFDDRLLDPADSDFQYVLGYAERVEYLSQGVWRSGLASEQGRQYVKSQGHQYLGRVRIARQPPGGWFRGAGDCSMQFRLEDILRHEAMHLIGISATIRESSTAKNTLVVGRPYSGYCFPGAFDRAIHNAGGEQVVSSKCLFRGQLGLEPFYVNNVQLFQYRDEFVSGTSMSHLRSVHAMLTPAVDLCDPSGVRPLTTLDGAVLEAIDVACDASQLALAVDGTFTNPEFLVESPNSVQNGSEYFYHHPTKSAGAWRSVGLEDLGLRLCISLLGCLLTTFAGPF